MREKISIRLYVILFVFSISTLAASQGKSDFKKLDFAKVPPDLVALKINVVPQEGSELQPGKTASVGCSFMNKGGSSNAEFLINIYMDGIPIADGGKATADMVAWGIIWTATAGTHTARCVLDTQNAIKESKEYNNEITYKFTVPGAEKKPVIPSYTMNVPSAPSVIQTDISIEKLEVKADDLGPVRPGKATRVFCHWKRIGAQPSVTFRVNVKMDGVSVGAGTVNETMTSAWLAGPWIATAGHHKMFCEVDYENVVIESNENNNTRTQPYNLTSLTIPRPTN
jgi:hypothetical protein